MAKSTQTIVTITDDLDGSEGAETVTFSFEGAHYEVDLNQENRDKLEKALAPFLHVARKAQAPKRLTRNPGKTAGAEAPKIRAWAKENGLDVPIKGRVPLAIQEAYEAAHQ